MTTARSQQVSIDATPYYHCVSRCVRRSFLCGYDAFSQTSYEHRRDWIESRIKMLATVYCIDICAYAVMSNHYHLVVHINKAKLDELTDSDVVQRWSQLHIKPDIIKRFMGHDLKGKAEISLANKIILQWRERLYSLSWFMRELNFDIALKANKEDNCKGHFWESRYKSQALLDEKALLAAMAYTDLNPVRSGTAKTLDTSDYTSIKSRLKALYRQQPTEPNLFPFVGGSTSTTHTGIPFRLMDYLELVEWSGQKLKEGKASLSPHLPSILQRLNLTDKDWLIACSQLEKQRAILVGCRQSFPLALPKLRRSRIRGYQLS
ncbi:transposase [Vibrio sp. MA40-2]|uniref:transposase n=1 Tax=Vibrio sp. MA40-2 TaxID=3391828 RepID=UPI0039A59BEA